jgi:hypothetical protein
LISCCGGGVTLTSGVDFGVAGGSRRGVDTGAGWGVEISRCSDLTPGTFRFGGFPNGAVREPPGIPEGFTVGEPPGIPEDFAPSRFGGTDFLPPTPALGAAPGVPFAFGGPLAGFTRLGGVCGPAVPGGEPGAPGDAVAPGEPVTGPWLPSGRFTKGVGFGRSFGSEFCSATTFLNLCASWGFTPRHPLST